MTTDIAVNVRDDGHGATEMIEGSTNPFGVRAARELLYVVASLPLGAVGFVTILAFIFTTPFAAFVIGLPILALGLHWARLLGRIHSGLVSRLLGVRLEPPVPARRPRGFVGWIGATLRDGTGWRAAAYALVKMPIALVTFAISILGWGYGFLFATYPAWRPYLPLQTDRNGVGHRGIQLVNDVYLDTFLRSLAVAGVGLVLLLLIPRVVHGLVVAERPLLRWLLGGSAGARRVRELEETRAQAVDISASELRRIERDLHDGAQARLVALAMRLGMAKDRLDNDDQAVDLAQVRELVDNAHRGAKETLHELRELARGIHPPILDRGLEAALTTLAARSAVPVRLSVALTTRPSPAVESMLYFCAAELLANVAKHSSARVATVDLEQDGDSLCLRVGDDGVGGAAAGAGAGTGLTGLAERVRPVDGRVTVTSPAGGPTVVTVELPATGQG